VKIEQHVKTAPEDLPLPGANQTLFKRYQSVKNLPGSGYDSVMFNRRIMKKESMDPSGTLTTAPGTLMKPDGNEL
jgi:hypothetical protein